MRRAYATNITITINSNVNTSGLIQTGDVLQMTLKHCNAFQNVQYVNVEKPVLVIEFHLFFFQAGHGRQKCCGSA